MKITGFDKIEKKLKSLANNAKKLHGRHSIPIPELLSSSFLRSHTRFSTADELFKASGFKIETQEDLKAIPDDKWDEYIRSISNFSDWRAMLAEAAKVWTKKQLGL